MPSPHHRRMIHQVIRQMIRQAIRHRPNETPSPNRLPRTALANALGRACLPNPATGVPYRVGAPGLAGPIWRPAKACALHKDAPTLSSSRSHPHRCHPPRPRLRPRPPAPPVAPPAAPVAVGHRCRRAARAPRAARPRRRRLRSFVLVVCIDWQPFPSSLITRARSARGLTRTHQNCATSSLAHCLFRQPRARSPPRRLLHATHPPVAAMPPGEALARSTLEVVTPRAAEFRFDTQLTAAKTTLVPSAYTLSATRPASEYLASPRLQPAGHYHHWPYF